MSRPWITVVLLVLTLSSLTSRAFADDADFEVIVNAQNPIGSLDRHILADIFFKKLTHWPADGIVQPVDLRQDSPIRQKFSEEILNRPVMGIKSYWQQLIFSGQDVPPPELKNDEDVIHFVAHNANAVGYVSTASVAGSHSGVKMLAIK